MKPNSVRLLNFVKTFEFKFNQTTGIQEIISPNEIKARAQQYKNDALAAIDANLNQLQQYADLNTRRATRRGISLGIPVNPTFEFKNGAQDSAYDKLKANVDAAESKIKEFVAQHGAKAKIPVELQVDFKNKSALLKAADDAVKITKPKATRVATLKDSDFGDLAIAKRFEKDLANQVQNLGGKAPQTLLDNLEAIRRKITELQALSSAATSQRVSLPGLSEIVRPGLGEGLRAALQSIIQIKATTPAMFAKSGVKDFLTGVELAAPSLDALQAKIDEVRNTIATLALNKKIVPPELIQQLKDLKALLAETTQKVTSTETNTDPGNAEGKNDDKFTQKAQARIDKMRAAGKAVNLSAQELGAAMKQAAQGFAQASFAALEAIGTALVSGGNPLKAALKSITQTLGDYLIKQGEALALAALFGEIAAAAAGPLAPLLSIPIGFQLAAAGVLIAGGAAVKGLTGFAKGGVFTQPSLGIFGDNLGAGMPGRAEIATPQDLMAATFRGELNRTGFDTVRQSRAGARGPQVVELNLNSTLRGADIHLSQRRYITLSDNYNG